ncbi:MAG: hypothetical protein JWN72_2302 [Thermoleophilia bacterium]|nr:hypothetical protein [Thermoleophilia bacterium]
MPSRTTRSAHSLVAWISLATLAAILATIAYVSLTGDTEHATTPLAARATTQLVQRDREVRRRQADWERARNERAFSEQYAALRADAQAYARAHEPRRPHAPHVVRVAL